ncbi:hypothetical protein Hanom_Chr05g00450551 [Helianthus anomalus]
MSPITLPIGMVSMTHLGSGSDILIRPQLSNAPSNLPFLALICAPLGAPPHTKTSTTATTPCTIRIGSSTAEPATRYFRVRLDHYIF